MYAVSYTHPAFLCEHRRHYIKGCLRLVLVSRVSFYTPTPPEAPSANHENAANVVKKSEKMLSVENTKSKRAQPHLQKPLWPNLPQQALRTFSSHCHVTAASVLSFVAGVFHVAPEVSP